MVGILLHFRSQRPVLNLKHNDHEKDSNDPRLRRAACRRHRLRKFSGGGVLRIDHRHFQRGERTQGIREPLLYEDQQPLRRRRTVATDDRIGHGPLPARQESGRYGSYGLLRSGCQQRQCLVAVEPLLQGAGQHQHVHGDHRHDAFCRRVRETAMQGRNACDAVDVPVDHHRDMGRLVPAPHDGQDRGHGGPPFHARGFLRGDHRRSGAGRQRGDAARRAHLRGGPHRHADGQGIPGAHVPLPRAVRGRRTAGLRGDRRALRLRADAIAQGPLGRRQDQRRVHLDDEFHQRRVLCAEQRLLAMVRHVHRPLPRCADDARVDRLRRLPGHPVALLHRQLQPRCRPALD